MKQLLTLILTCLIISRSFSPVILMAQGPQRSGHRGLTDISSNPPTNHADVAINNPMISTTSPSAIILTSFDDPNPAESNAFPVGISQEELARWFGNSPTYFTGYDSQENVYDIMHGSWSWDDVDTHTPGVYYAFFQPNLEDLYLLDEGLSLPQQVYIISIQIPGQLEINSFAPARGAIRFPWVLSPEQLDQFEALRQLEQLSTFGTVWLREDNKQWVGLSDDCFFVSDALNLPHHLLKQGSTYDLQVDYPGGQTGIVRFQFTWPLSFINYSEGDRDGGDVGGGDSSTGSQPAPSLPDLPGDTQEDEDGQLNNDSLPPLQDDPLPLPNKRSILEEPFFTSFIDFFKSVPTYADVSSFHEFDHISPPVDVQMPGGVQVAGNSSTLPNLFLELGDTTPKAVPELPELPKSPELPETPEAARLAESPEPPLIVQESYSPERTVISALRLRDLCTDEESVVFGSGNLTVSIPSKLLMALNLTDSDFLSVDLAEPEDNQISLAIEASGKAITQIPGTVLRMRYTPQSEDPEITVRNEVNNNIMDSTFDEGVLRFTINTGGTYRVSELPKSLKVQKAVSPQLPFPIMVMLATGGMLFFRRKRNG